MTAGPGWFGMKIPEMTPEVKSDLELLKKRSHLQSNKFYKRNDMKEVPKFFQMGKIVDSPLEFYDRIPKKDRKQTFTEEVLADQAILSNQKRKYSESISRHDFKRRRISSAKKEEFLQDRNKSKAKQIVKNKTKGVKKINAMKKKTKPSVSFDLD